MAVPIMPRLLRRFASTQGLSKLPHIGKSLHEYTSGRFLFNEERRLRERRLNFNVHELSNTICRSLDRPLEDLLAIDKFAEGGFNRMLQATFNDGREMLVRLPFRLEAPLRSSVASEAATLSYLHNHGVPVPKVLGYSYSANNAVGIEYILLEKLQGCPLGDKWFSLDNKNVAKVMKQIIDIEQKYMNLEIPVSGSLYHQKDLLAHETYVPLQSPEGDNTDIVVGPIASYAWSYRERANLAVD